MRSVAVRLATRHTNAAPDRTTAAWNQLLCSLSTGHDPRKDDSYVDILFMGLKGGSGAMKGTDGYDHIGMIDASIKRRLELVTGIIHFVSQFVGVGAIAGQLKHEFPTIFENAFNTHLP